MDDLATYLATTEEEPGSAGLLRDVAYDRIRDAIRHGVLEPGQPLSETRLSKLLGISRTPVREALQSLAQEGLVQIIPGRAITVASPSVQEVLSVVHIRSIIEPEVARLAAESISETNLAALWETLGKMEAAVVAGDRTAWSKADSVYHEILSAACPNQLLGELAIQIRNRVSYVSIDVQTSNERLHACTLEHRRIVERIAARDPEGAETVMREHIGLLRRSMFHRFSHA